MTEVPYNNSLQRTALRDDAIKSYSLDRQPDWSADADLRIPDP